MKLLIITHVEHKIYKGSFYAYAPYVLEMNVWLKHVDEVEIIAPQTSKNIDPIDLDYKHDTIRLNKIPNIEFTNFKKTVKSVLKLPLILIIIFKACRKTDHIHLRCPGNIGLLGCMVQVFFPKKIKTAKYAGNWDPNAIQPLSYKIQKSILSNTSLTKNMTALVYGDWKNQTKNIKSFFTATYSNGERKVSKVRKYSGALKFVFVGSLVEGKRPFLAIQIVEELARRSHDVSLDLYGDGVLKADLLAYIDRNNLNSKVKLLGNQEKNIVKEALKDAHFLILASKSEGWPKAIAEAMFFGVVPISTSISCVPYMLDYGNRGVLITPEIENAVDVVDVSLSDLGRLKTMSKEAVKWSQTYTLDVFEEEIIKLLKA